MSFETFRATYSLVECSREREIKELKNKAGSKLLHSRAPKCLWDDCLELKAYIRSNTAHEIHKLNREIPETVMSGETSDISQF